MGGTLRELSGSHQVLCVTHQPQIAALGHQHVLVSKTTEASQTFTQATPLERQEKVEEVARLLSGINITGATMASAEEMVERGSNAGA